MTGEPGSVVEVSGPRVFISYSHDSKQHRDRVLGLAQQLRSDGVDAWIDQYENGTPSVIWPRWMLNRLEWAQYVLVVCTETYHRRFRGLEAPGKGKGADWEGALLTTEIYEARSETTKFIPVVFETNDEPYIPEPLRGRTHYRLDSNDGYNALKAFLFGVAGVTPTVLGAPNPPPQRSEGRSPPAPTSHGDGAGPGLASAHRTDPGQAPPAQTLEQLLASAPSVREIKVFIDAHKTVLNRLPQYRAGSPVSEDVADLPIHDALTPDFTWFRFQRDPWSQIPNFVILVTLLGARESLFVEGTTKTPPVQQAEAALREGIRHLRENYTAYCRRAVDTDAVTIPLSTLERGSGVAIRGVVVVGRRKYLTQEQLDCLAQSNAQETVSIITYDALLEASQR